MAAIVRDLDAAAARRFDLIILGGGIYGAMLMYEATRRGMSTLLLEKEDFGAGTSFNSLRILHGGLRYLQSADLHRFRESVAERRWFLKQFPEIVSPLPCLLPMYGAGLRRGAIMRSALWANDLLSWNCNQSIRPDRVLPPGRILSAGQVRKVFPLVNSDGLKGGAIWYDAVMSDSQRILISLIRESCQFEGMALNYVEAKGLSIDRSRVCGVTAIDNETRLSYDFTGSNVINAAGPACRTLARKFDRDLPDLFHPSLAWNVLFRRRAISTHAVAVGARNSHGQTYFLLPWKGRLLAGTGHAPLGTAGKPNLPAPLLLRFIDELNSAVPGIELSFDDVLRIYSGFLPVTAPGGTKLCVREQIVDHNAHGGPRGLFSVSGVKFTTSRRVAEKTLTLVCSRMGLRPNEPPLGCSGDALSVSTAGLVDFDWHPERGDVVWKETLSRLVEEESVLHLTDLLLRRTNLGDNPDRALSLARELCDVFGWDGGRCKHEIALVKEIVDVNACLI